MTIPTEKPHPPTPLGFGKRIKQAMLDKASQIGRRYTTKEFAAEVGTLERGREKPYAATMITEWIAERSEPGLAAFHAMASVTGKDVSWLMALDLQATLELRSAAAANHDAVPPEELKNHGRIARQATTPKRLGGKGRR